MPKTEVDVDGEVKKAEDDLKAYEINKTSKSTASSTPGLDDKVRVPSGVAVDDVPLALEEDTIDKFIEDLVIE